ncbi:MAG: poly-beta-1,6-N-acetyl-D-glucosamine N-deacetylase PgaB [Piscirickettsiaceae bacterium]|nr:MAG: poly-beta-1,6-N-acetyl-D-glucosamine N-deacetylase PgaB [Piscirickettsiaceae bacterium]
MQLRLFILCCLLAFSHVSVAANDYLVLCYHDIRDDVDGVVDDDQTAVSTDNLVAQFSWLREHGYNMISLGDIAKAQQGYLVLPDKAVLLTFDDGYKSTYTHVYPLLKQFNYPAVVALVGKWLETPANQMVKYGSKDIKPRDFFMDWSEIKEMSDSGLIEIASHSHDLHKGILGNPQGNTQPAAVTFQYLTDKHRYEDSAHYKQRIHNDLVQNNRLIKKRLGKNPRAIVWPYGAFSRLSESIGKRTGLDFSLTLEDGVNHVSEKSSIKRILIQGNPPLENFIYSLRHPASEEPIRVAHVDLDYLYDADAKQQNLNLDKLLDRIKLMQINTVYLQAFADPDGDGNADALYFPNRHLPVRQDLFNRVAWQLKTRSKVNVYAWLPVLSFVKPGTENLRVQRLINNTVSTVDTEYLRLSPFNETARDLIEDIYEDLGMHANFAGIIFHDDAYLNDYEDFSPSALRYAAAVLKQDSLSHQDLLGPFKQQWKTLKTQELTNFTLRLANRVKWYRPNIKTARNIYSNVLINPDSEEWFNQNYQNMLQSYDYTAIMAMPYMEKANNPAHWLLELTKKAAVHDPKFKKTVFELQSVDWTTQQPIPNETLTQHIRLLLQQGVQNIGYYPDNFIDNHPSLPVVKATMSLNTFPFGQ